MSAHRDAISQGARPARRPRAPARTIRHHDRVRVYRASADRLLAALPHGSIDVLITDPPYTTVERNAAGGHLRRWFRGGMSWLKIGRLLAVAHRKLKPSGIVFLMTNGAGLPEAFAAMERAGFIAARPITWDRRWPGLGGGLRHRTEFVLLGRLPGSRPISRTDLVAVAAVGPGTANRYPAEKPVGLGRALARMAGIGPRDLVVDPFCGSGALLVGAYERGAAVIGGDISAEAVRRTTARFTGSSPVPPGPGTARASVRPHRPTSPARGVSEPGAARPDQARSSPGTPRKRHG